MKLTAEFLEWLARPETVDSVDTYTADDIAHILRRASIPPDELYPVLDELETAGLLRYCGDDDTSQFSTYAAIPEP